MSEIRDIICNYGVIRSRLLRPPNAVVDQGIDLNRKLIPPPAPVQEHHLTAKVHVRELRGSKPLTLNMIIRAVCNHYLVTMAEIRGPSRIGSYIQPRHVVCYLAMRHAGYSLPMVGRALGNRDHTTILHAYRKIKANLLVDNILAATVAKLEVQLAVGRYDGIDYSNSPVASESEPHLAQAGEKGLSGC